MSHQTQRTVSNFKRWLDQVVACGDWEAESDFIAPNFIVHDHTGTKRYAREEWIDRVSRFRPPDWRLSVHDLVVHGDRLGVLFTRTTSAPQPGEPSVNHAIALIRCMDGQFAETWITSRPTEHGAWPNLDDNRSECSIAEDPTCLSL